MLYAPRLLRPRVVREPVRHVDVLPTVLDALGVPAPPGLAGRSLLPLATGRSLPPRESYLEARPYLERFLREAPQPLSGRDFPRVRVWLGTAPPA